MHLFPCATCLSFLQTQRHIFLKYSFIACLKSKTSKLIFQDFSNLIIFLVLTGNFFLFHFSFLPAATFSPISASFSLFPAHIGISYLFLFYFSLARATRYFMPNIFLFSSTSRSLYSRFWRERQSGNGCSYTLCRSDCIFVNFYFSWLPFHFLKIFFSIFPRFASALFCMRFTVIFLFT